MLPRNDPKKAVIDSVNEAICKVTLFCCAMFSKHISVKWRGRNDQFPGHCE